LRQMTVILGGQACIGEKSIGMHPEIPQTFGNLMVFLLEVTTILLRMENPFSDCSISYTIIKEHTRTRRVSKKV